MIKKKHQCNLGYVGHGANLVKDKEGDTAVLCIAPLITLVRGSEIDELYDEMLQEMVDDKEAWLHWQDTHLVDLETIGDN